MSNLLTDRDFWVKYWESKTDLSVEIPENYLFHRQLADIVAKEKVKTAIELGGFPGYYAVFLKKYLKLNSILELLQIADVLKLVSIVNSISLALVGF